MGKTVWASVGRENLFNDSYEKVIAEAQDKTVDIFIGDADVHLMIRAINALYDDVWVTGNHEYDFSM